MTAAEPASYSGFEQIRYEVEDGLLTITLNRAEALNAVTPTMTRELLSAFDAADRDDRVRAVIVTGAGRGFCAGVDLGSRRDRTFDRREKHQTENEIPADPGGRLALRIYASTKPVIAAINGAAVGLGLTLTLPMDIRLVAAGAKLGFVFVRRGITPESCSTWFLPRLVGISKAMEWMSSGRILSAEEALAAGLVRNVTRLEDLLPTAVALARELVEHSAPVAVSLTRQMLWRNLAADHPMAAQRAESRALYFRGQSLDAREGVNSFLEKRQPSFTDRVSDGLPDLFPDSPAPTYS